MRPADNINELIKKLKLKASPDLDKRVHNDISRALTKSEKTKSVQQEPNIWRTIMNSRIPKLAAAAVIIIAAGIFLYTNSTIVPTAYALQDTIEAYNSVSSLHMGITVWQGTRTDEVWLECDRYGNISRIRYHTPNSGDLGSVTIVESDGKSEAWLPRLNVHMSGYRNLGSVLGVYVSQVDPKGLVESLYQQELLGEVILDVNEPVQKDKPIEISVTYPEGSLSENWKKVLYIDQGTKLVKKIDKFEFKDEQYQHDSTIELLDYNQQIDPAIFSFEREIPSDAIVMDMTGVEVGLLQGDMTEEETATEITRQLFEALIAKDYIRAGQLCIVGPAFLTEQLFEGVNLIEITSIEPARPSTDPDEKGFTCSGKVLFKSGGLFYVQNVPKVEVRQINTASEPNRWMIVGLSGNVYPLPGSVTVSKSSVDLDAVTYDNLAPGEFMKKWLVLGPLPYPYPVNKNVHFASEEAEREARASFDTDSLDFLNFTPKVKIDNTEYEWAVLVSEDNMVDLTQLTEEHDDRKIAYLWAQIDMPEDRAGTLGIGSDDGVKVWLNGELVHNNWMHRIVRADNDRVPVTLRKGKNELVLKVQNVIDPWGFCCRLLDE
jgi:hypothetical protein